jgi:CO/xanthine dehydrogenase Mo-binding subunit
MKPVVLPRGILKNPSLHQWLTFEKSGVITLHSGKVELGQGVEIALQQIACDALGIDPDQLQFKGGNTLLGPDEGHTAGSQSIEQGGHSVRMACLFARQTFMQTAADELGVAPEVIELGRGTFSRSGSDKTCSYWSLLYQRKCPPAGGSDKAFQDPTLCRSCRARVSYTTLLCPACCTPE